MLYTQRHPLPLPFPYPLSSIIHCPFPSLSEQFAMAPCCNKRDNKEVFYLLGAIKEIFLTSPKDWDWVKVYYNQQYQYHNCTIKSIMHVFNDLSCTTEVIGNPVIPPTAKKLKELCKAIRKKQMAWLALGMMIYPLPPHQNINFGNTYSQMYKFTICKLWFVNLWFVKIVGGAPVSICHSHHQSSHSSEDLRLW